MFSLGSRAIYIFFIFENGGFGNAPAASGCVAINFRRRERLYRLILGFPPPLPRSSATNIA